MGHRDGGGREVRGTVSDGEVDTAKLSIMLGGIKNPAALTRGRIAMDAMVSAQFESRPRRVLPARSVLLQAHERPARTAPEVDHR